MGYISALVNRCLDFLVRSSFNIAPDGRRLFFPFGIMGRGYVIGTELDYERIRRQVKSALVVMIVLLLIGGLANFLVLMAVPLIVLSVVWMNLLLRGLTSPAEKLSRQESTALWWGPSPG